MDLVKLLSSTAEACSFSNQSLELVYGLQAVRKGLKPNRKFMPLANG